MHFEQLEYVIEIAKEGTISKAAQNLHVSHSAISQAIASLESELCIKIFNRSRSGCICTEEGQEVIQLSYEIINKIKELKELSFKSRASTNGELKISAFSIFFLSHLPEALSSFKKDYPNVKIEITEDDLTQIIDLTKSGYLDFGFLLVTDDILKGLDDELKYERLFQSKIVVCVSKNNPLSFNSIVKLNEVIQHPLILQNDKLITRFWYNLFTNDEKPNILFTSNNNDTIKKGIVNNLGVGFFTEIIMKDDPLVKSGDIKLIPLVDQDNQFIPMHFISLRLQNKHFSIIEQEFLKYYKLFILRNGIMAP
jgi:DNA-binding transcriptional LysR family regulator